MFDFLKILIRFFEENNIPYMLSGGMAMSAYVVPRFTKYIDFVVHLKREHVPLIVSHLSDGYYCDEDAILDAIRHQSMFNIIDHKSNFKADFVVLKNDNYSQTEFERRKNIDYFGMEITIVSQEDLLLSKLIWIQVTQSSQQMNDIKSLWEKEDIDRG